MFPYIKKAQELNWGIIIFNPNENYGRINKDGIECGFKEINGSESPQNHCIYVWERFVRKAKAKRILLVAHSFGGICTTAMIDHLADEFKSRVKGIALTDSVHSSGMVPKHSDRWFRGCTVNWIKSSLPLNDPVPEEASQFYGCRCTSAGHSKHEYTSGTAIEPVFEFLKGRLEKAIYDETRESVSNNESEKVAEKSYEVTVSIHTHEPSKVPHETNKGDEQLVANNEGDAMEMSNESPETGVNTETQEQPSQVTHEKGNTVITNEKDESVANNESKMEVADESLETGMNIQTQESGQVTLEQGTEAITNREDNQSSGANYKDEKDEMNTVETVASTQQHHESSQMPPEVITAIPGGDETMETDESSESVKNAPKEDAEMIIDAELNKDSGEFKKENNTSENQLVTPKGLPKEMSTDSTEIQHSKDEIIQDNNKENTNNSLTSDQNNKVKQESDYKI
ncbi:14978_t:CDS:2 [Funneliformis mosseae]|uniref:14978_t:CDS:1 n=1 Tax=Funneliformis mosseae TaxID=27381 RepID=A0A9N8WGA2_FUNMO|nr:14978_t:CDS:2 [Funneliformis mosseae]